MEIRYGKRPFADLERQYGKPNEGEIGRAVNDYTQSPMKPPAQSNIEMPEQPQRMKFSDTQFKGVPPRTNEIDEKTGLTVGFNDRIKAILEEGNKKANQALHPYGENPTVADIRAGWERENPREDWQKQNPFAEGMGYELASDDDLRGMGYTDEHINDWKSGRSFHPQEIEYLRSKGVLKAPYADYLARQEELRRQAEEQAMAQQYVAPSYEPSYSYEEPIQHSVPVQQQEYSQSNNWSVPFYSHNDDIEVATQEELAKVAHENHKKNVWDRYRNYNKR